MAVPTSAEVGMPVTVVSDPNSDSLVSAGDPSNYQFTEADLTADSDWHDLDLSAIVPAGATWVMMGVTIQATTSSKQVFLREKGLVNGINSMGVRTQVANHSNQGDGLVKLDSARTIQYWVENTVWVGIGICVRGWIL